MVVAKVLKENSALNWNFERGRVGTMQTKKTFCGKYRYFLDSHIPAIQCMQLVHVQAVLANGLKQVKYKELTQKNLALKFKLTSLVCKK